MRLSPSTLTWPTATADQQTRLSDRDKSGSTSDGVDGLVAAAGREWGAPVVSAASDLTHEETRRVVAVEAYR